MKAKESAHCKKPGHTYDECYWVKGTFPSHWRNIPSKSKKPTTAAFSEDQHKDKEEEYSVPGFNSEQLQALTTYFKDKKDMLPGLSQRQLASLNAYLEQNLSSGKQETEFYN